VIAVLHNIEFVFYEISRFVLPTDLKRLAIDRGMYNETRFVSRNNYA